MDDVEWGLEICFFCLKKNVLCGNEKIFTCFISKQMMMNVINSFSEQNSH